MRSCSSCRKCEQPGIRARMVANLRNVDEDFARRIADGLRLAAYPDPTPPARPPITDLPPSPALSIVRTDRPTFAGRKIGVLITDGTDAALLAALRRAADGRGCRASSSSPRRSAAPSLSDGTLLAGAPEDRRRSVGAVRRRRDPGVGRGRGRAGARTRPPRTSSPTPTPTASSSATTPPRRPSSRPPAWPSDLDDGYVEIARRSAAADFIERCRDVRYWARASSVDQT